MRELTISQDIDPDSLVNDVNEAQVYAQMLQGMMANAQQGSGAEAGPASQQQGMALMEEYLLDLQEVMIQAVVMAQSESELRQTQGKLGLLEILAQLKKSYDRW